MLIQDGFEGQANGAKPAGWDVFLSYQFNPMNQTSASATVDTSKSKNGSASVLFRGGQQPAQILRQLPAGTNKLYLAAWVNMSKKLGNDPGDNHEHIMGIKRTPDANDEIRFGQIKGHLGTNHIPSDDISPRQDKWYSGPEITANTWHCVQLELRGDLSYNTLNAWVDGTLVHTVDEPGDWNNGLSAQQWMADKFNYVMFGFHSFSGNDASVWMDDITVATEWVDCP